MADEKINEKTSNLLTYAEIKKRLREPIPQDLLSHKKVGGANIDFVNITTIKDLLDRRLGDNHWESRITDFKQIGDFIVMTVSISINATDGIYTHDGTGHEKANHSGFGDLATNSYAQAFRRAAEGHGLARELWRDELSDEQWNLPATEQQIKNLHARAAQIERTEAALAGHYTEKRTDLFGEMTIAEADFALRDTAKYIKKDGRK